MSDYKNARQAEKASGATFANVGYAPSPNPPSYSEQANEEQEEIKKQKEDKKQKKNRPDWILLGSGEIFLKKKDTQLEDHPVQGDEMFTVLNKISWWWRLPTHVVKAGLEDMKTRYTGSWFTNAELDRLCELANEMKSVANPQSDLSKRFRSAFNRPRGNTLAKEVAKFKSMDSETKQRLNREEIEGPFADNPKFHKDREEVEITYHIILGMIYKHTKLCITPIRNDPIKMLQRAQKEWDDGNHQLAEMLAEAFHFLIRCSRPCGYPEILQGIYDLFGGYAQRANYDEEGNIKLPPPLYVVARNAAVGMMITHATVHYFIQALGMGKNAAIASGRQDWAGEIDVLKNDIGAYIKRSRAVSTKFMEKQFDLFDFHANSHPLIPPSAYPETAQMFSMEAYKRCEALQALWMTERMVGVAPGQVQKEMRKCERLAFPGCDQLHRLGYGDGPIYREQYGSAPSHFQ